MVTTIGLAVEIDAMPTALSPVKKLQLLKVTSSARLTVNGVFLKKTFAKETPLALPLPARVSPDTA